jgi:hypothetical protein
VVPGSAMDITLADVQAALGGQQTER